MAVSKRKNKKIITNILSIACMVVAVVGVFGYALPAYNNAKNLGISVGDRTGTIVGNVIGSFDGITTGLAKGAEDGKEEGLSAKDTKSEIKNSFSEIGNLEVLEAGVKLKDVNTLGDDYAALFLLKGVAIYSVNLKDVEINDIDANTVEILLPPINVEIYIDESATEKLAEYQKHSWSGSAKDGFAEYMNTRAATDQSVKETMENYSNLTEAAQSSAIKQIEIIAKAATGNKKEVVVSFKEGE
ncbi:MAG: DUF4230 domain-containing protein [Oribacterium sp.]|nr:DUF4230 domain-containing protein [Oribacterium sp.]